MACAHTLPRAGQTASSWFPQVQVSIVLQQSGPDQIRPNWEHKIYPFVYPTICSTFYTVVLPYPFLLNPRSVGFFGILARNVYIKMPLTSPLRCASALPDDNRATDKLYPPISFSPTRRRNRRLKKEEGAEEGKGRIPRTSPQDFILPPP